ncbi:putative MFS family arabinose efflux permease [Bradyrhizobium sp. USDA 4461]
MKAKTSFSRPSIVVIVTVAAAIMSISMGIRQCFGLFLEAITSDLGISATAFGFALALQNLVWGVTQPIVGALGDRFGPRPVLVGCGLIYLLGLVLMSFSSNPIIGLDVGIGAFAGLGIAGTGFGVLLGAVSRAAPPERASQLLGLVSGAGSIGVLGLAPLGQQLLQLHDWRIAILAYAGICGAIIVLSIFIGSRPAPTQTETGLSSSDQNIAGAMSEALSHGGFVAMTVAFFACGFQLAFITAHLPRFLGLCGLPPSVGATALGLIGVFNAIGSYTYGVLGARYSRKRLLAGIYAIRTLTIIAYISFPITEPSTFLFAAVMGFTWLGVVPLVSGLIGRLFGLGHFNLLFGVVFFCHQLGGFLGPIMGGWVLDTTGGYQLGWYAMIAIGAAATILQWPMNDTPKQVAGQPAIA